jgi:hypothetical protein
MTQRQPAHPVLERLDPLIGEWAIEATVGGETMVGGRTSFAWIMDGRFLAQHTDGDPADGAEPEWVANSPMPVDAIIGLDAAADTFSMVYADARGVHRVYLMTLANGVWRIWRAAPGFHQRFTGTFGNNGNTVNARWETSADGSAWKHDFDLTYTKLT